MQKTDLIFVFYFSPPAEESFDPSTYVIGPEEDLPRKLEYFTFVMHAPDDYFYYRKAPYPTVALQTVIFFIFSFKNPIYIYIYFFLTFLGPRVCCNTAGTTSKINKGGQTSLPRYCTTAYTYECTKLMNDL